MIGSGAAAVVCVTTGTTANAIGVGGIPGILSIQPQFMASFGICMLIAFGVPFLLTTMVGRRRLTEQINEPEELAEAALGEGAGTAAGTLTAFLSGKAIPLAEVGDGVFSAGILGDGIAIIPRSEEHTSELQSP